MRRMNVLCGWTSPRLWVLREIDVRKHQLLFARLALKSTTRMFFIIALAGMIGTLKWIHVLVPHFSIKETGWYVSVLGFYLNGIHGPYVCWKCKRATTQSPDLKHGAPAHCSRAACAPETA